jgi:DNA-binding response OmpR family regulator
VYERCGDLDAALAYRTKDGVSSVSVAYAAEEITAIVLGRASAITTGFASAVEAAGWRWEETPDLLTIAARPLPARAVILVPIAAFTTTAYAMIRHLTSSLALPVVAFSAEYQPEMVNSILQAGADDFLPLPVTVEEMVARLAAVIRVHFGARDDLARSDYRLDEGAHLLTISGGPPIHLSVGEYRLFRMLFAARNRPVARERLATIPLPHTDLDGQNALDATVSRLRHKVGADRIVTIRGTGYQLIDSPHLPPNVSYLHAARGAR